MLLDYLHCKGHFLIRMLKGFMFPYVTVLFLCQVIPAVLLGSFNWTPKCLSSVKSNILWCVWDSILSISFSTVVTCSLITDISAAAITFSSFFAHHAVLAATEHVSKRIFYTKDPSKLQSISFFDGDSVPCDRSQLLLFSPQHFTKFG